MLINKLENFCENFEFRTSFHQFSVISNWFTDFPFCWDKLKSAWNNSVRKLEYYNCLESLGSSAKS